MRCGCGAQGRMPEYNMGPRLLGSTSDLTAQTNHNSGGFIVIWEATLPSSPIMKARRMRPLLLSAALLICIGGVTWLVAGKHISGSSGGSGILEGTLARFRTSERIPKTTPEERKRRSASIAIGAQQWYERLLEKYPEMKPVYGMCRMNRTAISSSCASPRAPMGRACRMNSWK